ncbi:unnamed protein product [Heligmosomoides polygyrus]|uniref:Venom protein n=1 Tax=Heligmosomoides polygyrus TaxID=6339 RepID=A0A3P8D887_HELPZ|nr:unnamed protein product [Heligmosomoides polygyrus]
MGKVFVVGALVVMASWQVTNSSPICRSCTKHCYQNGNTTSLNGDIDPSVCLSDVGNFDTNALASEDFLTDLIQGSVTKMAAEELPLVSGAKSRLRFRLEPSERAESVGVSAGYFRTKLRCQHLADKVSEECTMADDG